MGHVFLHNYSKNYPGGKEMKKNLHFLDSISSLMLAIFFLTAFFVPEAGAQADIFKPHKIKMKINCTGKDYFVELKFRICPEKQAIAEDQERGITCLGEWKSSEKADPAIGMEMNSYPLNGITADLKLKIFYKGNGTIKDIMTGAKYEDNICLTSWKEIPIE
jgi:hypothetical protein